jgi:hypothetical protein
VLETDPSSLISVTLSGTGALLVCILAAYPMPTYAPVLNDQQIADVLTFIRAGWNSNARPCARPTSRSCASRCRLRDRCRSGFALQARGLRRRLLDRSADIDDEFRARCPALEITHVIEAETHDHGCGRLAGVPRRHGPDRGAGVARQSRPKRAPPRRPESSPPGEGPTFVVPKTSNTTRAKRKADTRPPKKRRDRAGRRRRDRHAGPGDTRPEDDH